MAVETQVRAGATGADLPLASRRLRRLLFVSRHYASDFGTKVGGVFQRMRMLLDASAKAADAIDILFFVDQYMIDEVGPAASQASLLKHWGIAARVYLAPRATKQRGRMMQNLRALGDFREQEDYFRVNGPGPRAAIAARLEIDTDLVVAHRLYVGAAVVESVSVPVVMDLDDIEHRSLARQLKRPPHDLARRLRRFEIPALRRGELKTIAATRTSLVCSQGDHDYLATLGASNTTVIPNAMRFDDRSEMEVPASSPDTLFFIGAYGYAPNLDAAEYLITTIFPLVLARLPDVRLLIAGESVEKLPSHARRPANVDFIGFVANLADVYRRVKVVCCPILAGGGTRIKIIEAAAARKPIVSTTIGAEGLALNDGSEIVLADTPAAFASACVSLLTDHERAQAISQAAFEKARSLYDRGRTVDRIAQVFLDSARVQGAGR